MFASVEVVTCFVASVVEGLQWLRFYCCFGGGRNFSMLLNTILSEATVHN